MAQLRIQGVADVAKVKRAFVEGDGRLSVMTVESRARRSKERGPA